MAAAYQDIGNTYLGMLNYAAATEQYERAKAIQVKRLGEDDLVVASLYRTIGGFQVSLEDYTTAVECYEKAKAIQVKLLGPYHPDLASRDLWDW